MRLVLTRAIIAFACLTTVVLAFGTSQSRPGERTVSWRSLLQTYAATFSLTFTIECDARENISDPNKLPRLVNAYVKSPANVSTPAEFLDALRDWFPEAYIKMDDKIPGLVHIREKSLDKQENYLLDQKISIEFKGTVDNLISELKRLSDGLIEFSRGGISMAPFRKETEVSVKDVTYRGVLDAGMLGAKAKTSGCILWETQAVSRAGKTVIVVQLATPLQDRVQPVPGITWPPTTQTKPAK